MDRTIFRWINDLSGHSTVIDDWWKFYAKAGIVLFAVLLLLAYFDARRNDDHEALAASIWAGGAALVALGIGQLIGRTVGRARPYDTLDHVHLLVARTTDFSFPSDHATVAGAVAVGILLANRRWGTVAMISAALMAFARVYVGAHYPGDVLAGLLLGATVAVAGHMVVVPLLRRLVDRVSATPVRRLVTSAA